MVGAVAHKKLKHLHPSGCFLIPRKGVFTLVTSYAGHLQYFGSPQKYASQIQATGYSNLSDKGAAGDFIRDNPSLFGQQGSIVPGAPQQSTGWTSGGIVPGAGMQLQTQSTNTQQNQPPSQFTGTLPTKQYAPMMPWEEAMRMAGQKLDPLTELSRINLNNTFNKQKALLPKMLNARGQLYGGLRAGGETQLTQDQTKTLEELNLRANAEKSSMAENIRNLDYTRATKQADDMYQSEMDKYNAGYKQWETGMNNYRTDARERNNQALALANLKLQQEAAKRAAEQQTEQSAYRQERDAIGDQRYAQEFGLKQRQTDYDINKPYYNPGGSGSGGGLTSYQQYQVGRNTASDNAEAEQRIWSRAVELAKQDPRLNSPNDTAANTFDQLVDAYYQQLKTQMGGGTSGGMSDAELMQYLR